MTAETATPPELFDPDLWSPLTSRERRDLLAAALLAELHVAPGVTGARIEVGPVDRPYDLTAAVETDVGDLRTPLWSHARATIFADPSIHPANRKQLAPGKAVREAAERLRARLAVPFRLESRGLTATMAPEPGVERTWTAERSRFRNRARTWSPTRETWTCATCWRTSTPGPRSAWWARTGRPSSSPPPRKRRGRWSLSAPPATAGPRGAPTAARSAAEPWKP